MPSLYSAIAFFSLIVFLRLLKICLIVATDKPKVAIKEITPDISVVIPTYNDATTIVDTLNSINAQTYQGKINVVVIDDGSKDGAGEKIQNWIATEKLNFDFVYAKNEKNQGRKSLAINAQLDKIKGKYLVIIDGDGIIDKNAVKILVNNIENAKPNTTIVSGRTLVNPQGTFVDSLQDIEYYYRYYLDFAAHSIMDATFWSAGALSIISTDAFLDAGGCNPDVLCEDTVFSCKQTYVCDKLTKYEPDALAFTAGQPSLKQLYKQRTRWVMAGLEAMSTSNFKLFNKKLGANLAAWSYIVENLLFMPLWLGFFLLSIITLNPLMLGVVLGSTLLIQLMTIFMIEVLGVGKPENDNGKVECKHSLLKRVLYILPMHVINSVAMIEAIYNQLTKKPKTWSTR